MDLLDAIPVPQIVFGWSFSSPSNTLAGELFRSRSRIYVATGKDVTNKNEFAAPGHEVELCRQYIPTYNKSNTLENHNMSQLKAKSMLFKYFLAVKQDCQALLILLKLCAKYFTFDCLKKKKQGTVQSKVCFQVTLMLY